MTSVAGDTKRMRVVKMKDGMMEMAPSEFESEAWVSTG